MATTYQPLLGSPKKTDTSRKALYAVLSLATIAVVSITILNINSSSSPSLGACFCHHARDQSSCLALVSEVASPELMMQSGVLAMLQRILQKTSSRMQETIELASNIHRRINDQRQQAALADCLELMDLYVDRLMDSMVALGNWTARSHSDVHSWLRSVLTNHVTCMDGLNGPSQSIMESMIKDLVARARTSLAAVVAMAPPKAGVLKALNGDFPSWVTSKERQLLQASARNINANVVVAKDGSGKYKTVQEAVTAAPNNAKTRYVIYVKRGIYKENVDIGKSKKNLMLVGDDMDATIITGSLNVVDGSTTFKSATVAAVADGFIAQDIWFKNTAGPQKHQAVALRIGADQSVINRCKIDAYQDTLYAHSLRQFYRDCYITGTVDFIFGAAAVVFQNSKLVARKPMSNQQNMVNWPGYHIITNAAEARKFTVAELIQGEAWLKNTGVAFTKGLLQSSWLSLSCN